MIPSQPTTSDDDNDDHSWSDVGRERDEQSSCFDIISLLNSFHSRGTETGTALQDQQSVDNYSSYSIDPPYCHYHYHDHDDDDDTNNDIPDEFMFRKQIKRSDGKTARTTCRCNHCTELFLPHVKRTVSHTHGAYKSANDGSQCYLVDELDITHPESSLGPQTSLSKHKRWDTIHEALASVAIDKLTLSANQQRNSYKNTISLRCTIYDVPIAGEIRVNDCMTNLTAPTIPHQIHPWLRKFKPNTYFVLNANFPDPNYALVHGKRNPYELVSSVYSMSDSLPVADMHVIHPATYKSIYGASRTRLRTTGSETMYSRESVAGELQNCARNFKGKLQTSPTIYSRLHQSGFVADCTPSPKFKEWYVEFDFHRNVLVTNVLIVGRAPKLQVFPELLLGRGFDATDIARFNRQWNGFPRFPCIVDPLKVQFVKRVEITARGLGGNWFLVGEFEACKDPFNEFIIRLSNAGGDGVSCRYLRVRPLSKSQGGFEGHAPAMRVVPMCKVDGGGAVNNTAVDSNSLVPWNGIPDGVVRYEVFDGPELLGMTSTKRSRKVYGPWRRRWAVYQGGKSRYYWGGGPTPRGQMKRDLIGSELRE